MIELFPAAHRHFIHSLPVFIEDDDLFVIHGKWPIKQKVAAAENIGGFDAILARAA